MFSRKKVTNVLKEPSWDKESFKTDDGDKSSVPEALAPFLHWLKVKHKVDYIMAIRDRFTLSDFYLVKNNEAGLECPVRVSGRRLV